ncbi:MAG: hypothetical protein AB1589_24505 [Cyanobacteriota bacterium]
MGEPLNQNKPEDHNQGKPKIAVIAVHGVADQSAHDSARAIASLLLNHNQNENDNQVQYTPFYESTLRIAVRPVNMDETLSETEQSPQDSCSIKDKFFAFIKKHLLDKLDERGAYIHNCLQEPRYDLTQEDYPTNIEDILDERAHGFMCDQIDQYKGQGVKSTYETVRLEGSRLGQSNKPQLDVHIYEMYWADLSRLGTGFVRIFGEFYQLLFHLSSLGREAVDMARIEYQDTSGDRNSWWNLYCWTQAWASRMLSVFIPILNLYLLLVTPITLPGNIPAPYLPLVAWSSLGIFGAALVGYFLLWRKPETKLSRWVIVPTLLVIGVLTVLIWYLAAGSFSPWVPFGAYKVLAVEWCLLATLIMYLLMKRYTRRRPGADSIAIAIGVVLALVMGILLLSAPDSHLGITDAAFKTVEVIYSLLALSWLVFNILQFAAALLGFIAVRQSSTHSKLIENKAYFKRAKQAAWTARLTLAIPSTLFIVVTLVLLTALARVGSRLLPEDNFYTPWLPWSSFFLIDQSKIPFSGPEFVRQLIVAAASPAFIVILVCILLTIVLAGWSLLPVAWAEVSPSESNNSLSERYGAWLTNGFKLLYGWGNVFAVLMTFLFPIAYVSCIVNPQLVDFVGLPEGILEVLATVVVASATSILAFRGRLDKLSLGFRNLLDIILDVDNYLRLHPLDNNPRARIYARYVSMLRYICRCSEEGQGYDAILIVAHSQGTVITADLLRFLQHKTKRKLDSALDPIVQGDLPIYFFTMGCPLRQLYGVGFPHLYNWARHYDQDQRQSDYSKCIENEKKPNPTKLLGVNRWVNTFRSGDYVGRYLWRSDACKFQQGKLAPHKDDDTTSTSDRDRPKNIMEDLDRTRQEFCLGGGAHTHYWDGTSDEVAVVIDILIREACREAHEKQAQTVLSSYQRKED